MCFSAIFVKYTMQVHCFLYARRTKLHIKMYMKLVTFVPPSAAAAAAAAARSRTWRLTSAATAASSLRKSSDVTETPRTNSSVLFYRPNKKETSLVDQLVSKAILAINIFLLQSQIKKESTTLSLFLILRINDPRLFTCLICLNSFTLILN